MTKSQSEEGNLKINPTTARKFSRDHLLNRNKLKKGGTRWNQYVATIKAIRNSTLQGPILDFGCGIGYFVLEGLSRGMDIWGVDASVSKIQRFEKLIQYTHSPTIWGKRCLVGSGENLPFQSNRFSAVSSWYVLEHVLHIGEIIRELVRITQKNGVITLRAQDARNGWEGHYKIPWIPFLSGSLAKAWVEEFGKPFELRKDVYDITQPQIAAILETLGCELLVQAPAPKVLIDNHLEIDTEEKVRKTARRIKTLVEKRQWRPQPENLYVYAMKK